MKTRTLATNAHECTRILICVHSCLFVAATLVSAADRTPRIVFTKSFPGSTPAYMEIFVDRSGDAGYKEAADDDPETFKLNGASTNEIFDLAAKLDHFKNPLESGLKVANMGAKTFRWEDGADKHQVTFNYSLDESAKALHDWFERIAESERTYLVLKRVVRHDRLGVNDAVISVQVLWDRKRLASAEQFLPLLDQVVANEALMHMARERAAQIAEGIRARQKSE
jgi:hypothetical protein